MCKQWQVFPCTKTSIVTLRQHNKETDTERERERLTHIRIHMRAQHVCHREFRVECARDRKVNHAA